TDMHQGDGADTAKTPIYLDQATEQGLTELLEKLAPLIQGGRLNNIIDLLSLASDMVDMSDEAMINKLSANYEHLVSAAWTTGSAGRIASHEVTQQSGTPSMFALLRAAMAEDVRRGLYFRRRVAGVLGRQMRAD